jgi:hypothetical protein
MRRRLEDTAELSGVHGSPEDALKYIINMIETEYANRYTPRKGVVDVLRSDAPYIIHRTDFPDTYLLVNRDYQPIGSNVSPSHSKAAYEAYVSLHIILTSEDWDALAAVGVTDLLFTDGEAPWRGKQQARKYVHRIKTLLRYLEDRA